MAVNLVSEEDLRAALRSRRVDHDTFEAAVRQRMKAALSRQNDPLSTLSPSLRSAAACLPLEVLTGGQIAGAAAKLAPATGAYKLLSYVAFPAISLFVLLGATVFCFVKIRGIRNASEPASADQQALLASTKHWWLNHSWGAGLLFAATLAMAWFGATWLLFLFYTVSLGLLVYVLTALARLGLGNRFVIGQACLFALPLLGQTAGFPGVGDNDIHMLDQIVIVPVFFLGALVVAVILANSGISNWVRPDRRRARAISLAAAAMFAMIVLPLTGYLLRPILWPATPERIKAYVESFDKARFSSASWSQWEIVARWAVESKLDPDLSAPRRLLANEIAGKQNSSILDSAFRVGLVRADQLGQLKEYQTLRRFLLDDPTHIKETQQITTPDWIIYASVLANDLTLEQRDYLEKRLNLTLEARLKQTLLSLESLLRLTQLLEVIERPVEADRYRNRIHKTLREFYSTVGGGFQLAGGFKSYNSSKPRTGSPDATSMAVELMKYYGIPADLELDWVRSYLRPRSSRNQWIAAVTLDRLNQLPGTTQPSWLRVAYYERSLLAAVILVGLCIYATLVSPLPSTLRATDGPAGESSPDNELAN